MLIHRTALLLRLSALLFFLAALILLIRPGSVLAFLGLDLFATNEQLRWIFRILGAFALIPALFGPLIAAFAGERGLRQAASGMAFLSALIATLAIFIPVAWGIAKIGGVCLGYFSALAYFHALQGRRRNH